jgi:hypothetical protein
MGTQIDQLCAVSGWLYPSARCRAYRRFPRMLLSGSFSALMASAWPGVRSVGWAFPPALGGGRMSWWAGSPLRTGSWRNYGGRPVRSMMTILRYGWDSVAGRR